MRSEFYTNVKYCVLWSTDPHETKMSKASPILNGENTSGVNDFTSGSAVNMVAAIHDHISCAKPMDQLKIEEEEESKMTFPCEFDHMYASMTEARTLRDEGTEIRHLKELLLLHLDLIQQQSEQIVTKDKQLFSLRQENETLKQRLERMDRRVTLQKQREGGDSVATASPAPRPISPALSGSEPPSSNESPTLTTATATTTTITVTNTSTVSTVTPVPSPISHHSPREREESPEPHAAKNPSNARRRRDSTPQATARKRKKLTSESSEASVPRRSLSNEKRQGSRGDRNQKTELKNNSVLPTEPDSDRRKIQKRLKLKGNQRMLRGVKKDSLLTTTSLYYTPVGDCTNFGGTETPPPHEEVEVPSWRVKLYSSCYSMEGTENLDDEVFNKRHQRLEIDERRRKRWDIQRIREQRQFEKLRQRQNQRGRRGHSRREEEPLSSLWPDAEDAHLLEVADSVPVAAFGLPITKFQSSEFSLPWLQPRQKAASTSGSNRRQDKKR